MTRLQDIATKDELAQFLSVGYSSFTDLESDLFSVDADYRYASFDIPKKDGLTRTIRAPRKKLKAVQATLAKALLDVYRPPKCVHGFVRGKSIVSNADCHVGKPIVVTVDLQDFFNSIEFPRIKGLFMAAPFRYPEDLATFLARICCHRGSLPMGAPTSPILSNMVCKSMDREITSLAARHHCTYTRYADDMTFSFDCSLGALPHDLVIAGDGDLIVGPALDSVIRANHFAVNQAKLRLAQRNRRIVVTGLTVNSRLNVSQRYLRRTEAMLHAWKRFGLENARRHFEMRPDSGHWASDSVKRFEHVLQGRLAFIHGVRGLLDPTYARLASKFNELAIRDGVGLELPEPPKGLLGTLSAQLAATSPGSKSAYDYQKLVADLISEIWRGQLMFRGTEKPLNDGRKRIDIVYSNEANDGFFLWVGRHYRVPNVIVECKNYTDADPANPEIDQLAGRFTRRRGEFGIMACRTLKDRQLIQKRARDIADADHGYIVVLDDDDFVYLAEKAETGDMKCIDVFMRERFDLLVM